MHSARMIVRPARPEDASSIFRMIGELAAFEKLEDEVIASESDIAGSLFGEKPAAAALIASDLSGNAIGFALYFVSYSTFLGRAGLYLEDLYVRPAARGAGVGVTLLRELAKIAHERRCGRLEWSVLDWNAKAIAFYEALGARPVAGWIRYRLDQPAIAALAKGSA